MVPGFRNPQFKSVSSYYRVHLLMVGDITYGSLTLSYVCQDTLAWIRLPGYVCQDTFARIRQPGYVCQDTFARICQPGYVSQDTFARIRLPEYACQDTFAWILLPEYVCQDKFARIHLPGQVCQDTFARIYSPEYFCFNYKNVSKVTRTRSDTSTEKIMDQRPNLKNLSRSLNPPKPGLNQAPA